MEQKALHTVGANSNTNDQKTLQRSRKHYKRAESIKKEQKALQRSKSITK